MNLTVDTITLQYNFYPYANYEFYRKVKNKKVKNFHYIPKNYSKRNIISYCSGIAPFSLYYNFTHSYINVTVKPIIILKHFPVDDDCNAIENACNKIIYEDLKIPKSYIRSVTLNRIDFNVDYRISSDEVREIIYNLMSKTRDKLGRVVKTIFKTAIRYLPEGGYVEIITYDKEIEQILKYRYEDYEYVENLEQFKGVFRTEVRIKNKKLNQNKRAKNWGLSKDLCNYLLSDMKAYYWKQYAEKIWFTEPFYRIDVAVKLIKHNKTLTNATKIKLVKVLKKINKDGFAKTKEFYAYKKREKQICVAKSRGSTNETLSNIKNKKLCSEDYSTFNNYIKKIRSLGINPLTYDKEFKLEKIDNFSNYKEE